MKKCILIACVAFGLGWLINGWRIGYQIEELKKEHLNAVVESQIKAQAKYVAQVEEAGRIAYEAEKQKQKALNDARNADAVAKRLREQLRNRTGNTCSAISDRSETTSAGGDVCADMFARLDDFAGRVAAFADRSRVAGLACEKSYESLR